MIKRILCARVEHKEMVGLTSAIIPLSFLCVLLTGGGHAPALLTLPALILFGPLWFLAPKGGIAGLFFAIFGTYPLYLLYGLAFSVLSENREMARLILIVAVIFIHVISGICILIYKFQ